MDKSGEKLIIRAVRKQVRQEELECLEDEMQKAIARLSSAFAYGDGDEVADASSDFVPRFWTLAYYDGVRDGFEAVQQLHKLEAGRQATVATDQPEFLCQHE